MIPERFEHRDCVNWEKVMQQFHVLQALHMANQLLNNRYTEMEADMTYATELCDRVSILCSSCDRMDV